MEYVNKKIYAYGLNKHKPNCYGFMAIIQKVENGLVYLLDKNNPVGYQNYTIKLGDMLKWEEQKLYIIK